MHSQKIDDQHQAMRMNLIARESHGSWLPFSQTTLGVGSKLLLAHNLKQGNRMLSFHAFCTSADGSTVADRVWCTPGLALIQELQRKLPTPSFFTSADGGIVRSLRTLTKTRQYNDCE